MLVSAFELLFEPITPKAQPPINPSPDVPDPIVAQAFFASISNVGEKPVKLQLTFISTLSIEKTFTLFDTTNTFPVGSTKPLTFLNPKFTKGMVELPSIEPGETGLFLLQPDISALLSMLGTPPDLGKAGFAARDMLRSLRLEMQTRDVSLRQKPVERSSSSPQALRQPSVSCLKKPTACRPHGGICLTLTKP